MTKDNSSGGPSRYCNYQRDHMIIGAQINQVVNAITNYGECWT
ncbi:hypothetical protein [Bacillus sp. SM2101]|nr:hypothetical protein [Bacillus sp. SM2101]